MKHLIACGDTLELIKQVEPASIDLLVTSPPYWAKRVYNGEGELEQVVADMSQEIENIVYAEVTYAVRDSKVNGFDIKTGDIIGLINDEMSVQGSTIEMVALELLEKMQAQNYELLTLFYGNGIEARDAMQLKGKIMDKFPDSEVEFHYGGQPHYSYILSVE